MDAINLKSIKLLEKTNIERASKMFGEIYENDALMIYFFPEKASRRQKIEALFAYQLRCRSQQAFQTQSGPLGICVFEDSRKSDHTFISWNELMHGFSLFFQVGLASLVRLLRFQLFSQAQRYKAMKGNHWYLDLFAVEKKAQLQGIGRNFLKDLFNLTTVENDLIYLETTNAENERYYKAFGFQVIEKSLIPGTNISYCSMSLKLTKSIEPTMPAQSSLQELAHETLMNVES